MNNDLISREDLKEVLKECAYSYDGVNTWIMKDEVLGIIDNAPTVEVPENAINCVLTMFGKCSYNKTGCSDCEIKEKIRKALEKDEKNYNDAFIDGIRQGIDALNEVLNHQNAGRRLTMPNKRDY